MNRNSSIALLVVWAILLGLIITGIVVRADELQPGVLWEYKILRMSIKTTDTEQALNEYGKQGWEVIDWEYPDSTYILLKRQL
jgi:hypothetical protein